jgi:hypothetical protein
MHQRMPWRECHQTAGYAHHRQADGRTERNRLRATVVRVDNIEALLAQQPAQFADPPERAGVESLVSRARRKWAALSGDDALHVPAPA